MNEPSAESLVVRVLPDEPAIDREFDYEVPSQLVASSRVPIEVGTIVRMDLGPRRLRGWVTAVGVEPPQGITLSSVTKITGAGPPAHIMELAHWASHRWLGPRPRFLRTASPQKVATVARPVDRSPTMLGSLDPLAAAAFERRAAVVRRGPGHDDWPLVVEAARQGRALVLVPTIDLARRMLLRLRRAGVEAALFPGDWDHARTAQVVVGPRSAAWAPIADLDAVLVLDEHDEAYQEEAAPTWNGRDVALERARRDGAAWVVASPAPSLEVLTCGAPLLTTSRAVERASWPVLDIADRRGEDPTTGEWCSVELSAALRSRRRVVCVLNRKGRARLAYCHACGELARSETDGRALGLDGTNLVTADGAVDRPAVCAQCGSSRFRRVKLGVTGVAEELALAARRPVVEVSAASGPLADAELYVGTEAVLHRVERADVVAFLDIDQELLAPRYRAEEEVVALFVKAARLLGPRTEGGRLLVQTRMPDHPVLEAVLQADPGRLARPALAARRMLGQPPVSSWVTVSGPAAGAFMERLGSPMGLDVTGTADGQWRVRSEDRDLLLETLERVARPPGRLRIAVDPMRV